MRKFLTTFLFIFAMAIVFNACDGNGWKPSESKDVSGSVNSDSTGLSDDATLTGS